MSRHHIEPLKDKTLDVVVGWDRPLRYFFASVFKNGEQVWGTPLGVGVQTIAALEKAVKRYATIAPEIKLALRQEAEGIVDPNREVYHVGAHTEYRL